MSFVTILETLLLGPLKLIFETIFALANRVIGHPGLAIVVLSLAMNILVLPLYRRADAIQEEARDIDAKLHDGVAHIKKTFSGDERMMILQTYYRQNNYKPTDAFKGSISLLLEIPFFMAAYQFLSNLEILNGVAFGPIADLGAADGLIVIGGVVINLLPIIMTAVNVISSMLYLKGYPLKTKIQLYAMALFFLVFLYNSPACLVFYWTLNNVFSLVKTIFYKIKNPQKVLGVLCSGLGLMVLGYGMFGYDSSFLKRKVFFIVLGLILQLPLLISVIKSKFHIMQKEQEWEPNKKLFILGALVLTVLVGALIPSTFIAASPQEYVDITYFHNPLWYIVSTLSFSCGTFLVWMGIFYGLANAKGRVIFERAVWVLCGVMLVNYMFFGTELGIISSNLQYENGLAFSRKEQLINLVVIAVIALGMYFFAKKWKRATATIMLTAIIALGGMSGMNVVAIQKSIDEISLEQADEMPQFTLSKNGKNVVVIMLDRAMGLYVPYIMNEKPELKEKFSGFTYYANTVSFGVKTNIAAPALLGGYEYTPVEINKRSEESLKDKHNEALKVMPVLFSQNDYDVTVCDPSYANYQGIPDLSIYDEYPGIDAYITQGKFGDTQQKEQSINNNHRNFFCLSIMKSIPLAMQSPIYNGGEYNRCKTKDEIGIYSVQKAESVSKSTGIKASFMEQYSVLCNLSDITEINSGNENTFLSMVNKTTHEPIVLQTPDYVPSQTVNNTTYDRDNIDRFTVNGKSISVKNYSQMGHYHANMVTFIQLGNWFDYLKENDVYDNTRIILVSDHGEPLGQSEELLFGSEIDLFKNVQSHNKMSLEAFYPLFMVKDFDSSGFTVSNEFMTNADVVTIATNNLIDNPTNPFTGKEINSNEKNSHEQLVSTSWKYDIKDNNGNTFLPDSWLSVKNNIWDKNNWKFYDEEIVLSEHRLPE